MPRQSRKKTALENDPLWYKDAVIYELHIKAFQDSNEDGIGDIRGIISRLDYLQHLGVTAIWLLPFYPSPLRDDGYDIAKYSEIHPAYGNLADFRELLEEAHRRGLRIITELVINHTSDQHPWFQKSRAAKPGTKWRDFYVWSDTPDRYPDARIIFKDFETSNWTWDPVANAYYWHRFYHHQPDLNFDSPHVHKAVLDVIDYWFEMGVDGVRLDAVPYLYEREDTNCENLPETHAFLKKLRAHVDRKFANRMLLAEANQWSEDAIAYLGDGDECHMAFNFPVMPRMFMALQMEDRYPIIEVFDPPLEIPENCQWALFLRNHDELTLEMVTDEERDYMYRMYADDPRAKINLGIRRRLAPLLGNSRRRTELMNILLFSLPGTPVIYYGDEIGMGDNYYLGDRDGVRTPMQWSPDRNAGFSRTNPHKLYLPVVIDPEYHYEAVNVETQNGNLSTLLWWMRRVIAMRKRYKPFSRGSIEFLAPRNSCVIAFLRRYEDETILIIASLSRFAQSVELELNEFAGMVPREVFGQTDFPRIRKFIPYQITLGPHAYYWFSIEPAPVEVKTEPVRARPQLSLAALPEGALPAAVRSALEQRLLPAYLRAARWFGGKGRKVRSLSLRDLLPIHRNGATTHLLMVAVEYVDGLPETYQVPIAFALGERAAEIRDNHPNGVIADLWVADQPGIVYDAVYGREFRGELLDLMVRRRRLKGEKGELLSSRATQLRKDLAAAGEPPESTLLGVEQSNTSIRYGETLILKLYRKVEDGANPDAEVSRALSERARFPHTPAFRGGLTYRGPNPSQSEIALLQEFVPNHGDAWEYSLNHVGRYLDYALSQRDVLEGPPELCPLRLDPNGHDPCDSFRPVMGDFHTEMINLLGQRTGEMHIALAGITAEPEFAPEGFSLLYQRSIFQAMRNEVRQAVRTLQDNLGKFEGDTRADAEYLLNNQTEILNRLRRIVGKKMTALKIRIHGDYHLGQLLFTGKDFVIMDFEGEPARPLWERRLKRSPLRDVAGMVRSFDYAVNAGVRRHPALRPEDMPFLAPWVRAWYHYSAAHFLAAYQRTVNDATFMPKKREDTNVLFEAFLLSKALYELGYELNNRPEWVTIPLQGIKNILTMTGNVKEIETRG